MNAHEHHHSNNMMDDHTEHDGHQEHGKQGDHGEHHQQGSHGGHHEHAGHGVDHSGHEMMFKQRFWICLLLSIPVLLYSPSIQDWLGFSMPTFTGSDFINPLFSICVFGYGGIPFIQMAMPEVRSKKPGMMTLISLAIIVAFTYSLFAFITDSGQTFFWELVTLIDVMLLGHWMEMRSVRQASGALNELAKLVPDTAERLNDDGQTEEIKVSELQQGDLVLVRPGSSIPADGEIIEGESELNEAMITGESKPVEKSAGDTVIAGTINGDGSLRVKITATGDDTALAGIMRLVKEAQESKSETQILADKAAGWLFYLALGVAAITAIAWILADGLELAVLERVVTVLVIACPHALGLAIPLVVAISTSMGASTGILVRNRLALEEARLIDTVVFDKTGTLTEGRFGVVDFWRHADWSEQKTLGLALGAEGDSEHPIARGIRRKAEEANVTAESITEFEAIKGRGIKARWDGKTIHLGGPRLLEMLELDVVDAIQDFTDTANNNAQTVVYLVVENDIIAAFALADVIREESQQVINRLHAMNIKVAMLTGDSQPVANSVAKALGIDTVFAEVLPEHKDHKISELQKAGQHVAMVGDGVNDAPALTRAEIGIAIGSGTDVAIESADIILVQSNPLDVVKVFELSKATYRKMIQNLIWATGYNLFALPLAAGVLVPFGGFTLSPAVGAAVMSLSTIIVALNAQLLRRTELAQQPS